ncbi:MAG: LLM class F420-dependent oxidoreductase [Microthrixaceae bacterium]
MTVEFNQSLMGIPTEWYVPVAKAAEAAGFGHLALSDHVFYPKDLQSKYPYSPDGTPQYDPAWDFPDPWVTMAAIAAVTEHITMHTSVFIAPLREPVLLAKQLGSLARLSDNRVRLGVGVGWMREEFDVVGESFTNRGRRMDEMFEVLRAIWKGGFVEFHGEFYDFPAIEMRPAPSKPVPIWIGGHSELALRRAARNDGWVGAQYRVGEIEQHAAAIRAYREELGVADEPYDMVVSALALPTPDKLERLDAAGVTALTTSAWIAQGVMTPESLEHALDLVGSYGEQWITPTQG